MCLVLIWDIIAHISHKDLAAIYALLESLFLALNYLLYSCSETWAHVEQQTFNWSRFDRNVVKMCLVLIWNNIAHSSHRILAAVYALLESVFLALNYLLYSCSEASDHVEQQTFNWSRFDRNVVKMWVVGIWQNGNMHHSSWQNGNMRHGIWQNGNMHHVE